jgi:hypothetical protein
MSTASARLCIRAALASPLLLALLLPPPAAATTYQALCGNNPCSINFDVNGTVGAVGGGTAGAIAGGLLLGPIGLVGGMVGGALGETRSLSDLERQRDGLPQRLGGGASPQSIPTQSYVAPSRYR